MMDYKASSYIAYKKACDFLEVAKTLDAEEDFKLIPTVVNASFSCELFLKALLIWQRQSTTPIKKHSLVDLFGSLIQEDQDTIKANADIFDWSRFMREASEAFESWRYVHENDGFLWISIGDLIRFSEALKKHYEEKHSLKEVFDDE